MQITRENNGNLTSTVCIEVEKADYSAKVEEKLKDYRKKIRLPGFREGKVPAGMVNKMYGKAILAEEINTIISEALENYLNDNNINTLASPLPNREKQQQIDFDTQEQFCFYFDLAIRPDINPDLENLHSLKLYEVEPEESKTEEYITHILRRHGNLEESDNIEKDSIVKCEIRELNNEGETFEGGIFTESTISINKINEEDIRSQFIGAGKDKVVVMNPLKAFGNLTDIAAMLSVEKDNLPDPVGDFKFRVISVQNVVPALVNEDLLKEIFPNDNLKDEDEFRERVKRDVKESFDKEAQEKFFRDAIEELIRIINIELPDDFMKRWLLENGEDSRLSPEEVEEGYEDYARQLRIALLRSSLIRKYDLHVQEIDYHKHVMRALNMQIDENDPEINISETVKGITANIIKDKKYSEQIAERIIEDKLSDLMMHKVPYIKEVISGDSFYKLLKNSNS